LDLNKLGFLLFLNCKKLYGILLGKTVVILRAYYKQNCRRTGRRYTFIPNENLGKVMAIVVKGEA